MFWLTGGSEGVYVREKSMEGDSRQVHEFDYLLVIDLEATCDEGNPGFSRENQEVIEFPWVVVDLLSGAVLDQKQLYVKPEWTKELSNFCVEKTGITNDKLQDAPYLVDVLTQFDLYVTENFLAKGNCAEASTPKAHPPLFFPPFLPHTHI